MRYEALGKDLITLVDSLPLENSCTSSKIIKSELLFIKNTNDLRSYRVDSSKLLKLGFRPKKNVQIGIQEIKDFYIKKGLKSVKKNSFSINWLKKSKKILIFLN